MEKLCFDCFKKYEKDKNSCPYCKYDNQVKNSKNYRFLKAGTILKDRYIIGKVISYGGFGVVYKSYDKTLDCIIAIKELYIGDLLSRNPDTGDIIIYSPKNKENFEMFKQTFLLEAKNTSKFADMPNIIKIYECFEEKNTAYMTMEYMQGHTLKEEIKTNGKLDYKKAIDIISSICIDLKKVHSQNIIHRDISPDNIMILDDGSVKLFDFGAARFSDYDKELTRTNILKLHYAPPEQYLEKSKQAAYTDIYALGATLYTAIVGYEPPESIQRKEKDTLKSPSEEIKKLPKYIDVAIFRSMALEPELRFRDTLEFRDAILNKKVFFDVEKEKKKRKKIRNIILGTSFFVLFSIIIFLAKFYYTKKQLITYNGANINMILSYSNDIDKANKEKAYKHIIDNFNKIYKDVNIKLDIVDEKEYQNIIANNKIPYILYESDNNNDRKEELSDVLSQLDDDYIFKVDNDKVYNIALGYDLPIWYSNILLDTEDVTYNLDEFLQGKSKWYLGSIKDYETIYKKLPAQYNINYSKENIILYKDEFSINKNAKEIDKEAAKRFLYYMLLSDSQEILSIENYELFPVKLDKLEEFIDINLEFEMAKDYINSANLETKEKYYQKLMQY